MSQTYIMPDFSLYRPKSLNNLVRKLEHIDIAEGIIPEERFEKAMDKLKNNDFLMRKDYKALLYRMEEINTAGLMSNFIERITIFFKEHNKVYYHLKALLFSYYKLYKYKAIFGILKLGFSVNQQWREEIKPIRKIIEESEDIIDLLKKINLEFLKTTTIEELENKVEELMMNKDTPMLQAILRHKVLVSLEKETIGDKAEDLLYIIENYIPDTDCKDVFEKFLLSKAAINNESDSNIERWFEYIGDKLGDPYGLGRIKWKGIDEEAIKVFQLWRAGKKIGKFFTEIIGDPKRLNFWKQYTRYFYRVEYFEEYDKALLMETKEHLFIEFAKIGAMYMYTKDVLSIDKVEQISHKRKKSFIINNLLKSPVKAILKEDHRGYWQAKFSRQFSYYNYYIED